MSKINENKKQVNDVISIVKLASLLFSGMALFTIIQSRCNFILNNFKQTTAIQAIEFAAAAVSVLILVYLIWLLFRSNKFQGKYAAGIRVVESILFILIFTFAILGSGAQKSEFKLLFLFIIVTSTIESGMKRGIIISSISSVILLGMDWIYDPRLTENIYFENDLVRAGAFMLIAWTLGFYVKTEREYIGKLEDLANHDGLTGVYNHRFFQETLKDKFTLYEKENKNISLIFLDIDHFKNYNDLYGHQRGDEVLKTVGKVIKSSVRDGDIVARYGGEEFSVILPDTSEEEAIKIAEKIRSRIEETYFEGEENQPKGKLTASIGISVFPDKAKNEVELIKSADDALYRAKFFNKNRVEVYHYVLDDLKEDIDEKHVDIITSIRTLISVINAKDRYTFGHVERVVFYAGLLADKLELNEKIKKKLIYGAYIHDIGKINISEEILNKKMSLTDEECEILKQHPENGVKIIESVESLKDIAPLIMHHHERYDGKGYPGMLKGENIPYLARILTVADSFDAMTSKRPYSNRKTYDEAIEELKRCSGTQFDPFIVKAFIEVIEENKDRINS